MDPVLKVYEMYHFTPVRVCYMLKSIIKPGKKKVDV